MLPRAVHGELRDQLDAARRCWETDRARGVAGVYLPHGLRRPPHAAMPMARYNVLPLRERTSLAA